MKEVNSSIAAYLCLGAALALVLGVTGWGAWRDMSDARRALLLSEVNRLRSHAERTVGRIEYYLEDRPDANQLSALHEAKWLDRFWQEVVPREAQRLYAALLDVDGRVVRHTEKQHRGKRLDDQWFIDSLPEAGDNVVMTASPILAGGQLAFDIRIPIKFNGARIGSYHSGFDVNWLDDAVAKQRRHLYGRWLVIGGLTILIVLGSGLSLFFLSRRTTALQQALGMARTQQFIELGRLAGALAHEVRNPLNALRLNLHAIKLHVKPGLDLDHSREEIEHIVTESDQEIERLENLLKTILGYARPDRARIEVFDLRDEIRNILDFMARVVEHDDIELKTRFGDHDLFVRMDRDRFRQAILNLLSNARDAAGPHGIIEVRTRVSESWIEIRVVDNGPGVPDAVLGSIFDPFFTTKESGCGLGLALVKRFIEEADGAINLETSEDGTTFLIGMPRTTRPSSGTVG